MSYEHILFEIDGGVATVTLNRPAQLNAWTATMSRELGEAMRVCDADDAVRAVIVTGAGRAFCAGADLHVATRPLLDARAQRCPSLRWHRCGRTRYASP